jgi:hypothetical protein
MARLRAKRRMPVFGSLLEVVLSIPFGSLCYVSLSKAMMIGPYWSLEAWPDGQ